MGSRMSAAASALDATPSLEKADERWLLTVLSASPSLPRSSVGGAHHDAAQHLLLARRQAAERPRCALECLGEGDLPGGGGPTVMARASSRSRSSTAPSAPALIARRHWLSSGEGIIATIGTPRSRCRSALISAGAADPADGATTTALGFAAPNEPISPAASWASRPTSSPASWSTPAIRRRASALAATSPTTVAVGPRPTRCCARPPRQVNATTTLALTSKRRAALSRGRRRGARLRHGRRLLARVDAELCEHRAQMALDRALREEQAGRDLGVRLTSGDHGQDRALAMREGRREDLAAPRPGNGDLTGARRADGRHQGLLELTAQNHAARAGGDHGPRHAVADRGQDDDDRDARGTLRDPADPRHPALGGGPSRDDEHIQSLAEPLRGPRRARSASRPCRPPRGSARPDRSARGRRSARPISRPPRRRCARSRCVPRAYRLHGHQRENGTRARRLLSRSGGSRAARRRATGAAAGTGDADACKKGAASPVCLPWRPSGFRDPPPSGRVEASSMNATSVSRATEEVPFVDLGRHNGAVADELGPLSTTCSTTAGSCSAARSRHSRPSSPSSAAPVTASESAREPRR